MNKMDEMIVVCPRNVLFGYGDKKAFHGALFSSEYKDILNALSQSPQLMRRGDAEENQDYKQPIPYVVLTRKNKDDKLEVFLYKRLSGGGETRLHDKLSIGVGGHMNNLFSSLTLPYYVVQDAGREVREELNVDDHLMFEILGLINDDTNDVGKVHIGIIIRANLKSDSIVTVRETDQLQGDWVTVEELQSPHIYNKLESWSQYIVQSMETI